MCNLNFRSVIRDNLAFAASSGVAIETRPTSSVYSLWRISILHSYLWEVIITIIIIKTQTSKIVEQLNKNWKQRSDHQGEAGEREHANIVVHQKSITATQLVSGAFKQEIDVSGQIFPLGRAVCYYAEYRINLSVLMGFIQAIILLKNIFLWIALKWWNRPFMPWVGHSVVNPTEPRWFCVTISLIPLLSSVRTLPGSSSVILDFSILRSGPS